MRTMLFLLVVGAPLFVSCATPRSNLIAGLNFTDQPPRTLIDIECNGQRSVKEGVAVCEEKVTTEARIQVKILPLPGRVVYSDGISKEVDDFNYRKAGWIWKNTIIDTTWAALDLGELNSKFGQKPVAFDVQGLSKDTGIINSRGVIFHQVCNDKDIPCSKLIINYDCSGTPKNTWEGQLGACSRLMGSSQDFEIPFQTPLYELKAGAKIRVHARRTDWSYAHTITDEDIKKGAIKFQYPTVMNGPELFAVVVFQWEQGILVEYHTKILIVGYNASWTGIDRPHFYTSPGGTEICTPFVADLMEVMDDETRVTLLTKECIPWSPSGQVCAFAYDRESGDMTYNCLKDGKLERFP